MAPTKHSPDLRALTIVEGSERNVLVAGHPCVERLLLAFGGPWRSTRRLGALLLRVGLLRRAGFEIDVLVEGASVEVRDPFDGAANHFDIDESAHLKVEGEGVELMAIGLDRWIAAARAQLGATAKDRGNGADGHRTVLTLPALHLASPLSAVHPRLPWIAGRLRANGIPVHVPARPARRMAEGFVTRLTQACVAWKAEQGIDGSGTHRNASYPHILPADREIDGVWPPLHPELATLLPPRSRHSAFGNLKSSQSFALNVLGGLDHVDMLGLALERQLGRPPKSLVVERLQFEYAPVSMQLLLGEDGEHSTQIDAVVWLRERQERRALVIEVKLTESAFGACRGPTAEGNLHPEVCVGEGHRRMANCYLHVGDHRRRYLHHSGTFAKLDVKLGGTKCPLREDGYQIARNLIVTAWLGGKVSPGEPAPPPGDAVDEAEFIVLSARETPALHGPVLAPLGALPAARLQSLGAVWIDAADLVASVAQERTARALVTWLRERYRPVFRP